MKRFTRWAQFTAIAVMLSLIATNFGTSVAGQAQKSAKQAPEAATSPVDRDGQQQRKGRVKPRPTPDIEAEPDEANENDADRPPFAQGVVNSAEYLRRRQEYVNMKLGMEAGKPYDPNIRQQSITQMKTQEAKMRADVEAGRMSPRVLSSAWTNIGPFPLPNGQTNGVEVPVSGRTIAIAVHPTNHDIVYVGTAQGGLYRSTNGGQTWTQLFDTADSQVIGSIAISPSNPEIVYVGTGENGQCGSGCYAGVGVYRIDNASTTADLTGPINPQITTGTTTTVTYNAFTGRSISRVLVAPNDPSVIFVATASAIVGNPNQAPQGGTIPPLGIRGVFRINNANGPIAGMTIAKLTVTVQPGGFDVPSTGNRSIMDMAFDTGDATGNTLVCFVNGTAAAGDGGVYRSTNALTTGTFTQTLIPVTSNIRGELAVTRAGGVTTMYLASGETGATAGCTGAGQGAVRKSVDGGATWSARLAGGSGFCNGQCFYDIAVDVSPTDANTVLIGGNVPGTCTRSNGRSTNGGTTFPEASTGLHADSHVVAFAPSNPNRVYQGNDGGIFRSDDNGVTWTSLNNRTFVATQFQSVASHPTERFLIIGGTQDNGTELLQPNQFSQLPYDGWKNADFGDGGYARIDQFTSPDADNVVMYHTYFNQTNAQAIARVTTRAQARKGNWTTFGCGFGGVIPNGFNCVTTTACLFYAPFELGPPVTGSVGQPVYWGADALYRSINQAATFTLASQQPIVSGVPVSTMAIAPGNDNFRLVGLTNGTVWFTNTGAITLVNITPTGMTGTRTVGKLIFDPSNPNTAYVSYGGQFALSGIPTVNHIWKSTNINAATPTWTATANGLPDVSVNTLAVDPNNSLVVFAGTDVGVYRSIDGGANWLPYNTGMPKIAIFDFAVQNSNRLLRAATHGRGIWEIALDASVTISGQITGANNTGVTVRLTGSAPAPQTTVTDGSGNYTFTGLTVGGNYTVTPVATATTAFTPPARTYPDIPSSRTGQNFATTAPPSPIQVQVAAPGQVIFSEFRLRGASGAADEFVELYNATDTNITVSTSDGSDGWALDASQSDGTTRLTVATVPVGTVIPARGHYLLAAQNYSLTARSTADFYYTPAPGQADVSDNTGLALYSTSNRANFALANRLDAVGFTGAPAPDREGTGLTPIATNDGDYSFLRINQPGLSGLPQDTGANAADFALISPTGAVGATSAILGAPGPENLNAPIQRNATIRATYIDMTVSSTSPPNRVRDTTDTGVNKNFGTLTIRRRFTNNTGQTLTRLRFRIVDITTLNTPGAGPSQADLRALDSTDALIGALTVKGTQIELPPAQLLGGGLNTSYNVTLPDVGLAPLVGGICAPGGQCTIDVQFRLGVVQTGSFRFFVNVEALP